MGHRAAIHFHEDELGMNFEELIPHSFGPLKNLVDLSNTRKNIHGLASDPSIADPFGDDRGLVMCQGDVLVRDFQHRSDWGGEDGCRARESEQLSGKFVALSDPRFNTGELVGQANGDIDSDDGIGPGAEQL